VRLAHHLAVASPWIRGDCVEATEFPDLAQRYGVMAVPKTVVNDRVSFEGALPEDHFVDAVLQAVGRNGGAGEQAAQGSGQ
jgi:predicted DsbA family dithiol-disulfide isomerase